MDNKTTSLALAAGIGFIAGLRSMAAPALVSRHLSSMRRRRRAPRATRLLQSRRSSAVLAALAAGEMMADKTPFVPNRIEVPSLAGRAASGALCGAAIAGWRGTSPIYAGAVGGLAAIVSTYTAFRMRKSAGDGTAIPDPAFGVAEDAIALFVGSRLVASMG